MDSSSSLSLLSGGAHRPRRVEHVSPPLLLLAREWVPDQGLMSGVEGLPLHDYCAYTGFTLHKWRGYSGAARSGHAAPWPHTQWAVPTRLTCSLTTLLATQQDRGWELALPLKDTEQGETGGIKTARQAQGTLNLQDPIHGHPLHAGLLDFCQEWGEDPSWPIQPTTLLLGYIWWGDLLTFGHEVRPQRPIGQGQCFSLIIRHPNVN